MKCLILAAGYATRLYSLTKDCPKQLVEVVPKLIIGRILEKVDQIEDLNQKSIPVLKEVGNDK